MEDELAPTSAQLDGRTWKYPVASMGARDTCVEASQSPTSVEVGRRFHGSKFTSREADLL